jgi:hypothetical protein
MSPKPFLTALAAAAMLAVPATVLAAQPADPGPPAHAGKPTGQAKHGTTTTTTPAPATAPAETGTQEDAGAGYTDPLGPKAPAGSKAKAYGKYCAKLSRKHVAGQKGTPFSQCVTAMAKVAGGTATSPARACKALSRKHVAGQKGTPFSRCVSAAAKLQRDAKDTAAQNGSVTLTPRA